MRVKNEPRFGCSFRVLTSCVKNGGKSSRALMLSHTSHTPSASLLPGGERTNGSGAAIGGLQRLELGLVCSVIEKLKDASAFLCGKSVLRVLPEGFLPL
jgi:hypothetical protein